MSFRFTSTLFRYPGNGGWIFAPVPKEIAPTNRLAWGRTPVVVRLGAKEWRTSVWTDKNGDVLLPLSKKMRGTLGDGDTVEIELEYEL